MTLRMLGLKNFTLGELKILARDSTVAGIHSVFIQVSFTDTFKTSYLCSVFTAILSLVKPLSIASISQC